MSLQKTNNLWIITLTIVVGFVLLLMPLPGLMTYTRPNWVMLIVLYWVLALPHRVGIFVAAITGLMIDVARGTALGQHVFALSVITYVVLLFHHRIRLFPLWKQSIVIGVLNGLYLLILLWISNVMTSQETPWVYWLAALTSALFWPWVFGLLRLIRRYFRIQ